LTELKIDLKNNKENRLFIIVENMGRLNFGDDLLDPKVSFYYLKKYKMIILLKHFFIKGDNFKHNSRWRNIRKLEYVFNTEFYT
jgi:hypothetical protein